MQDVIHAPLAQSIFQVGMQFDNYWSVGARAAGQNDLVFKTTVYPPCPVTLRRAYRWNGQTFAFIDQQVSLEPNPRRIADCHAVIDHAASVWGPEAAIPLMQALLPNWPPAQDSQGKPLPLDARDAWLYRLGVYHALVGNQIQAVEQLPRLIEKIAEETERRADQIRNSLDLAEKIVDSLG